MVRAYQSEDRDSDTSNKLEQLSYKTNNDKDSPMGDRRKADLFSKQPTSPLLMMQKNYQDRIYAEKEKKMIEIFKKNQQSSLQTISDKSSKQVKGYFGRKLENPKKYKNTDNGYQKDTTSSNKMGSQKMSAKHLPPLVKNRKADSSLEDGDKASLGGNETKGTSKRLSKLTIHHKSKVKSRSSEQAVNTQSPVSHVDNSNGDNDSMNEVNRDCLRLIRDKRVKEKKQELLKSNNRRRASNRDEVHDQPATTEEPDRQSKYVTPKPETNVHRKPRKSKISSFSQPRDSQKASPAPSNSNHAAEISKMAPVGGQHSNDRARYEKPTRNRPFVSISPEERKEINFNETYSKHKRKVEPSTHGNDIPKENNPIFGIPNFNKPVKVRRDGRNTSNSTYSTKPQETMKNDISTTKTSDYHNYKHENNRRYDNHKTVSPSVDINGRGTCNSTYSVKNYTYQESMKNDISATKPSDYYNYDEDEDFNEEIDQRYDNPTVVSSPKDKQSNSQNEVEEYEEVALDECNFCGRRFAVDRLEKHRNVCQKLQKKQRKVYNMSAARQKGTDMENFKPIPKAYEKEPIKRKNWRTTHDELIQTIQHARVVTAHVASGGRAVDLPPPPPSSNPDYVHCQYCDRKFAPHVAERHIPRCKETKARPPPPKRKIKAKGR